MKKFIKNIVLFFSVYLALSGGLKLITPYYVNNHWLAPKFHYIKEAKQNPNTVFLGSSRIYRHVIPSLYDSLVQNANSFNLGAPSTFSPQTYYLLENIIHDKQFDSLKYCFIELTGVDSISGHLLHQPQANYWLSPEYFMFSMSEIIGNPYLSYRSRALISKNYTLSFLDNILNLGHYKDIILKRKAYFRLSNTKNKGFLSLDDVLKNATSQEVKEKFMERKMSIEQNPELLNKRAKAILSAHQLKQKKINQVHLKKINELIDKCQSENVQLIFVLLPKYYSLEAISLISAIPKENVIDLSNPAEYPEFYTKKYSFDIGHLNYKGARRLTRTLAIKFNEIKNE